MTVGEAKTRALHLLDETGASSSAAGYLAKFYALFDMAQREIATIRPVTKVATITMADGKAAVPTGMYTIDSVTKTDFPDISVDYYVYDGYIYVNEFGIEDGDTYSVKYRAYPAAITSATADETEFEVDADAQDAIPFYAAANAIVAEDHALYVYLMGQYTNRIANLASGRKSRARVVFRERGAWL